MNDVINILMIFAFVSGIVIGSVIAYLITCVIDDWSDWK